MPTIEQNNELWDGKYEWPEQGDEWSRAWGGVSSQWFGTLLPRLKSFVPAPTILEIAPGFGRWTQFLRPLCSKLVLVDVSPKCIAACQRRFAGDEGIQYHVNDGQSLAMVADESVDFAFSFDSPCTSRLRSSSATWNNWRGSSRHTASGFCIIPISGLS